MINPQNTVRNCCFFEFNSPTKRLYLSPEKNKAVMQSTLKIKQKKSLKPFRSVKLLMSEQFTGVSVGRAGSSKKSIINQLYLVQTKLRMDLQSAKQQTQILNRPSIKIQSYKSPQKTYPTLLKAKSLTRVSFNYNHSGQTVMSPIKTNKISSAVQKQGPSTNFTQNNSKPERQSRVSSCKSVMTFMKREQDDDLRSTMEPFIEMSSNFIARPKSIISVNVQDDISDPMDESIIIAKHSSSKNMQRLI